jgi:hypothetical protein
MKATETIIVALLLALAGCGFTPGGQAVREGVATYGAQAMDEGLVNAEWFVCEAASVGSIKRRYGKTKTTADAYRGFCPVGVEVVPVLPE